MNKRILFLIGSPKPKAESASVSIEARFIKCFRKKSFDLKRINLAQAVTTEVDKNILLAAVDNSDILVLISPVYLDTAPSFVIKAMEFLNKKKHLINTPKKMLAISICGYPEAFHNDTVLRVYKRFADDMGFIWIGGLAIGEGPAYVYGRQIFSAIGMYHWLKKSIALIAHALVEGKTVPEEAIELMKISVIPNWLYTQVGILCVKILALKNGVWNLYNRPYALQPYRDVLKTESRTNGSGK
ncbi:MAG: hypothetical protein V1927_05685 [Candidatus Omnitrophota bacterium]